MSTMNAHLTEMGLLQWSIEVAIADIITRPSAEWAGWVIYLLEHLDVASRAGLTANQAEEASFTKILETIEDALMTRLSEGCW